jgi:hypothetical protein
MRSIRFLILFSLFLLMINFSILKYPLSVFSLNDDMNINNNNTWISQRNNLNITMKLLPEVPIIDQKTNISFEIRTLNDSKFFDGLNAKVTMTDHDSRLFKFENKVIPISNGKFSVEYIFPDDGEHRIILQLYENTTAFDISSFDIFIPHPQPQPPPSSQNLFSQFFDNIF